MILKISLIFIWIVAFANFAGAVEYYFPIMAAGFTAPSADTFYVTEFVINHSNSQRVTGFLSFFTAQGAPMEVGLRFVDGSGSSTTDTDNFFDISIPGNGT